MQRTSRPRSQTFQCSLIAGALFFLAGCADSQTGAFKGAASEKAAAEKGLAPGSKTQLKAAAPPSAKGKNSKAWRAPDGGAPNPN
jgi:hypothetical protein